MDNAFFQCSLTNSISEFDLVSVEKKPECHLLQRWEQNRYSGTLLGDVNLLKKSFGKIAIIALALKAVTRK